jgi:S-methylmethionine-dependent homocysteine/selenocysteine methylase
LGYTAEESARFMQLSIELVAKARDDYIQTDAFKSSGRPVPLVGLSLGSYGAMLCGGEEYSGSSHSPLRPLEHPVRIIDTLS